MKQIRNDHETNNKVISLANITPPLQTPYKNTDISFFQLHCLLACCLACWTRSFGFLRCRSGSRLINIHAFIRHLSMCSFSITGFTCSFLLHSSFIFISLQLLTFFQRNDVFPAHIVFDIANCSKLCKEVFTTQRGTNALSSLRHGLMIFGTVKDIIEIHFVKFLVLRGIILIKPRCHSQFWRNIMAPNNVTYIFWAPYFRTAVSSSLLKLSGLEESLGADGFELRCAWDVSIWLITIEGTLSEPPNEHWWNAYWHIPKPFFSWLSPRRPLP